MKLINILQGLVLLILKKNNKAGIKSLFSSFMYVECEKKNFAGRIYRGKEACFFISQILTHKDHRSHHELMNFLFTLV